MATGNILIIILLQESLSGDWQLFPALNKDNKDKDSSVFLAGLSLDFFSQKMATCISQTFL